MGGNSSAGRVRAERVGICPGGEVVAG
ncbi:hypothetical protein LINPERHAP2_LOCUS41467 [Linum perenne]